jgi:hypothetical protein
MRNITACLLFAFLNVVLAPSSQELHTRYGEPNLERFMARPGIAVSVEYGADGAACSVLIEPPRPLLRREENGPLMLSDTVTDILEEIAPVGTRGPGVLTEISAMGCSELRQTDYQEMTIGRQRDNCESGKPEHEVRATVTYKRDVCRASAQIK